MINIKSKLLDEILNCPELEWEELDRLVKVIPALSKVQKGQYQLVGALPIIDQGIDFIGGYTNDDLPPVDIGECIVFGDHSEHIKYVDFPFIQGADGLKILKPKKDIAKYIYYAFINFYIKELSYKRHWTKAKKTKLPIPSISTQQKIVDILDTFTTLTAELTAELTARKQQYEYYRDELLTFGDDVKWSTLNDIGPVRMCKRVLKNQTSSKGDVPFYKIGTFGKEPDAYISQELFEEYREKYNYPKKGDILISASGTIGRTVRFNGEDAYFQDSNIVWIENDESIVLNDFLWHFYKIAKWGASDGGTISRLYNSDLQKVKIQIPSLAEQAQIVEVLDKFDALTHSITEGLSREIELREQQYEYYRDLLLSFPKPDEMK